MTSLKEKTCIPCQGGVPPLPMNEKLILKEQLDRRWSLTHDKTRLTLEVQCDKFEQPMKIANEIAKIADEQWHHPDLHVSFGKLRIDLWTHKIDNLVESDYILAAKIDEVLRSNNI